jgi:hypothetical protein
LYNQFIRAIRYGSQLDYFNSFPYDFLQQHVPDAVTRPCPKGAPTDASDGHSDGGMAAMEYINADDVVEGIAQERGHLFPPVLPVR